MEPTRSMTTLFIISILACYVHQYQSAVVFNPKQENRAPRDSDSNWFADRNAETENLACRLAVPSANGFRKVCSQECGKLSRISERIVNGEKAAIKNQPWMVGMQILGYLACGGALLNRCFVLSASHCLKKVSAASDVVAIFGTDQRYNDKAVRIPFSEIYRHPDYVPFRTHNDIALLKLSTPVDYNTLIRPVCLPTTDESYLGMLATVVGFGYTKENGTGSSVMNQVSVRVIDFDKCVGIFNGKAAIYSENLCAGGDDNKDSCSGDSGGPLILQDKDVNTIIGVVSWGKGCARPGMPGVYSRTAAYLTWIDSIIYEDGCCGPPASEV